jgi:Kef-type K+ transport system membrane component KefB
MKQNPAHSQDTHRPASIILQACLLLDFLFLPLLLLLFRFSSSSSASFTFLSASCVQTARLAASTSSSYLLGRKLKVYGRQPNPPPFLFPRSLPSLNYF